MAAEPVTRWVVSTATRAAAPSSAETRHELHEVARVNFVRRGTGLRHRALPRAAGYVGARQATTKPSRAGSHNRASPSRKTCPAATSAANGMRSDWKPKRARL